MPTVEDVPHRRENERVCFTLVVIAAESLAENSCLDLLELVKEECEVFRRDSRLKVLLSLAPNPLILFVVASVFLVFVCGHFANSPRSNS